MLPPMPAIDHFQPPLGIAGQQQGPGDVDVAAAVGGERLVPPAAVGDAVADEQELLLGLEDEAHEGVIVPHAVAAVASPRAAAAGPAAPPPGRRVLGRNALSAGAAPARRAPSAAARALSRRAARRQPLRPLLQRRPLARRLPRRPAGADAAGGRGAGRRRRLDRRIGGHRRPLRRPGAPRGARRQPRAGRGPQHGPGGRPGGDRRLGRRRRAGHADLAGPPADGRSPRLGSSPPAGAWRRPTGSAWPTPGGRRTWRSTPATSRCSTRPCCPGRTSPCGRDVVRALGGYDESFRTNYEDADLQHRLQAAGYPLPLRAGRRGLPPAPDTASSVLRTYWGWLRPPFERQGAFRDEAGLSAKAAGQRRASPGGPCGST